MEARQARSSTADGVSSPRLAYVIGRLDSALRRQVNAGVRPLGLTAQQYVALSILRYQPGLSNAQLARRSFMTPQSMSEALTALERKGFILRRPDPANGRILRSELTEVGLEAVSAGDRVIDELEQRMTGELSTDELDQLISSMKSCVRMLGAGLANV